MICSNLSSPNSLFIGFEQTPNIFRNYFRKTNDGLSQGTRQSVDSNNLHASEPKNGTMQKVLTTKKVKIKLDGSLPANSVNDRRKTNAVTLKSTFCLP